MPHIALLPIGQPMATKNLQFRTATNRAATVKERYTTAPIPSDSSTEQPSPKFHN